MNRGGITQSGVLVRRWNRRLPRVAAVLLLASGLVWGTASCSRWAAAPYVAVREERLRSEDLKLPLDEQGRRHLLAFLESGGDREHMGSDPVYLDARARYQRLLGLLSAQENLGLRALTSGTYAAWFEGEPNDQVIDARQKEPPLAQRRLALTDERFWFVFSVGDNNTLTGLVVFPASRKPKKRIDP